MDLLVTYVERVQWDPVMFTVRRILLITIVAWVALTAKKIAVRCLDAALIDRGRAEGDILRIKGAGLQWYLL